MSLFKIKDCLRFAFLFVNYFIITFSAMTLSFEKYKIYIHFLWSSQRYKIGKSWWSLKEFEGRCAIKLEFCHCLRGLTFHIIFHKHILFWQHTFTCTYSNHFLIKTYWQKLPDLFNSPTPVAALSIKFNSIYPYLHVILHTNNFLP